MATRKFAVFGNPVEHSRSPEIHQAFARQAGIDITYDKILVPTNEFTTVVKRFVDDGGDGFNVTVPFKEEAHALADSLSPGAGATGAVNTVSVDEGRLIGYNTDGPGLITDMVGNLGWSLGDRRILILGAGGAVRGILWAMLQQHPKSIDIFNRTAERARQLIADYDDSRLHSVDEPGGVYDVVVNGTSAALQGQSISLPDGIIGKDTRCYDLVYGGEATAFTSWGRKQGSAEAVAGLGMLVEQAALAFNIWTDFKPETKSVIRDLRGRIDNPKETP
ncbi:MAG: shikimate dehydrogenase [Pseudomonadales bacterium]|nr:shikimate dehydrogenase [Pseudomonadales bacterium]